MNRRDFLKSAALVAAGAMIGNGGTAKASEGGLSTENRLEIRNRSAGIQYRPMGKSNVMVSPLGFGMMRLPRKPDGTIDEELSRRMVHYAIDNGLNYVDTSYVYLGGKSEEITGRILNQGGYRNRVYLATKFPWWDMESDGDFDRIVAEQFERLGTEVIDCYLLHNIAGTAAWKDRILPLRIVEKIVRLKEEGKVRQIGFSFHTKLPTFKEVIQYTPEWDFCQVQHNYHDTEFEAGTVGIRYAADRGLGVVIMEPLSGGYLANPPAKVMAVLKQSAPNQSPVDWAFRYLWDMPEVSVALSGMSAMEHVTENIALMSRASVGMLTAEDKMTLARAVDTYQEGTIPCTGCENCHPCPKNVAMARNIRVYNQYVATADLETSTHRYNNIPDVYGIQASACTDCGICRCRCPMGIDIPEAMRTVRSTFERT
ncbi:MAG: aldo/keto reductase [Planctomycetes bacterium]|nr:aldo/keto reductase [Planctomycetota bacterium]